MAGKQKEKGQGAPAGPITTAATPARRSYPTGGTPPLAPRRLLLMVTLVHPPLVTPKCTSFFAP
eukprot:360433-Chlamydomonas_euryale.AAC.12